MPKMNSRPCPFCGKRMVQISSEQRDLGTYRGVNVTTYECTGCHTIIPMSNIEDLIKLGYQVNVPNSRKETPAN